MPKLHTLSKVSRIKKQKAIEALFAGGRRLVVAPFRVQYGLQQKADDGSAHLQVAVSVPKRIFKKAVHRNRIKRLMRESWRLQKAPLEQRLQEQSLQLQAFIIYTGNELPPFSFVSEKMAVVLQKLESSLPA